MRKRKQSGAQKQKKRNCIDHNLLSKSNKKNDCSESDDEDSILDSESSWSVKDTDDVSCSEAEFSEKEAKQVKRKKKRVYVTGKMQRKEVLIQKDVPVLSEPYVSDSESEMSEACVSDNMSVRFPLLTESNAVSNSSESEAETEDIVRDIDNSKIYIKALKQSSTTKQGKKKKNVFNATHACPFCDNLTPNFSRHIIEMHGDWSRVKDVLKIEVKGKKRKEDKSLFKKRKRLIDQLQFEGDHKHNKKVLKEGSGLFILGRRDKGHFSVKQYGPCHSCFQWLKLRMIPRHQGSCPFREVVYIRARDHWCCSQMSCLVEYQNVQPNYYVKRSSPLCALML